MKIQAHIAPIKGFIHELHQGKNYSILLLNNNSL